jgi:hypothetical protein
LAGSGNWHTATNSFELQQETYSRYWFNSGKPISAISCLASHYQLFAAGAPFKCIKYIFWLKTGETGFLQFKEQSLFKLKNIRLAGSMLMKDLVPDEDDRDC